MCIRDRSWKAKRPASWTNHKQVASSITQDVSSVELWDDEIEEREHLAQEKEQEKAASEDWDAPESQTNPGSGLTWDEMIPKDHGVAPSWVERQEREKIERSLPWRCHYDIIFFYINEIFYLLTIKYLLSYLIAILTVPTLCNFLTCAYFILH